MTYRLVSSKPVGSDAVVFDGLEHSKQYRVKIIADDGNTQGIRAEYENEYSTLAPILKAPVFTETNGEIVTFKNITETSFTAMYTINHIYDLSEHKVTISNKLDPGSVIFSRDMGLGNAGLGISSEVNVTGLSAKNIYELVIYCSDRYGNQGGTATSIFMPDKTTPVLSETSAVKTGTTTAEVKWKVTDLSDVTVTIKHFESTNLETPIGTSTSTVKDALQTLQLTNLKANTDYTVYIQAKDETNPETPVVIHTFKTDNIIVSGPVSLIGAKYSTDVISSDGPPQNAFDNNPATFWHANSSSPLLQVQLLSPTKVATYKLQSRNTDDPSYNIARALRSWTLQGSSDGITYKDIDIRDNQNVGINIQTFTVQTPALYSYYRLRIRSLNIASVSVTGIAIFALFT